jgi:hypothetical protein
MGAKVMKRELNFLQNSGDCKGKFSSQKVGRSGAQLHLNTRNQSQGLISQKGAFPVHFRLLGNEKVT